MPDGPAWEDLEIKEDLNDFSPSQYMTLGHFIVGSNTQIETYTQILQKMLG